MHEKRELRRAIRCAREGRASRERDGFQEQLAGLVGELGARRVSCFVGVGSEPDTSGFLEWARAEGVEVLLPRVLDGERMEWVRLGGQGFAPGAFGIPEPVGPASGPDALAGVDLVLVPAAAVDRDGTRLGWGRGYFDRALAAIRPPRAGSPAEHAGPPLYAVVYASEIVDGLPAEPHDAPVHGAVTELGAHRFG